MTRGGARRFSISLDRGNFMYIARGGQRLARRGGEKPPGQPGAAVYRHTLDRVNAINDSLKKN